MAAQGDAQWPLSSVSRQLGIDPQVAHGIAAPLIPITHRSHARVAERSWGGRSCLAAQLAGGVVFVASSSQCRRRRIWFSLIEVAEAELSDLNATRGIHRDRGCQKRARNAGRFQTRPSRRSVVERKRCRPRSRLQAAAAAKATAETIGRQARRRRGHWQKAPMRSCVPCCQSEAPDQVCDIAELKTLAPLSGDVGLLSTHKGSGRSSA